MARIYKSKSKASRKQLKAVLNADPLKKVYDDLEETARKLMRSDLQLHNANERFDQQISQLHALHRIGACINSTFDIEVILSAISESMAKDLDFEKSGIVFLEKTSRKPLHSAYTGFSAEEYRRFL